MTFIITLLIIYLLLWCAFEQVAKKKADRVGFATSLYQIITLKAVNYIFNTSNSKIVLAFVRGSTTVMGLVLMGIPILNGEVSSNHDGWKFIFNLDWGTVDIFVIITYFLSNAIIIGVHIWRNRKAQELCANDRAKLDSIDNNSTKAIATIEQAKEAIVLGNEVTSDIHRMVLEMYRNFKTDGSETLRKLFPIIVDEVRGLKLSSAHKNLKIFLEEAERVCPDNIDLLSIIYLWIGNCAKYSNIPECTNSYDKAFDILSSNNKTVPVEIVEAKIFSECAKGNKKEAIELISLLNESNTASVWTYVPIFYFSENRNQWLKNTSAENPEVCKKIIIESSMLFQIMGCLNDLDEFDYEINTPNTLTYENLSEWILSLFLAIGKFAKTTFYTFDGRKFDTPEVKLLFELSSRFMELAKSTEIMYNIPDLPLFNAIAGYLYTKEFRWIQILEGLTVRDEVRPNLVMTLCVGYFEQGNVDKAIEILETYPGWENISVRALHALLLLRGGRLSELQSLMESMVLNNYELPNSHIVLIFNIVKCVPTLANVAEKIKIQDKSSQQLYQEFVKALSGNDCNKEYLLSIHSIPSSFSFHYSIVLYMIGEKDKAYELMKDEVSDKVLDGKSLIYLDLLEELGHRSEAYNYIHAIRKNGIVEFGLLKNELIYAMRLHLHEEALIISKLIIAQRPNVPIFAMYHIICLHHAKEPTSEILNYYTQIRHLAYSVSEISNITAVLFSRGLFGECVDFLYEHAVKSHNQEIYDIFFNYRINPNIQNIVEQQHDVVESEDYILCEINGEETWEEIVPGSSFDSLIGHVVGEEVMISVGHQDKKVKILSIYTKYFRLLKDVMKSIESNKSKKIWSISIDDLQPDILAGMQNIVARYNGGTNHSEEREMAYKNHEIPLTSFVNGNAPIHSTFSLIMGRRQIDIVPTDLIKANDGLPMDRVSNFVKVLDITSSVLIWDISVSFQLEWSQKFIVPQSLFDYVDQELNQLQNKAINEPIPAHLLDGSTIQEISDSHPLVSFSKWLHDNCVSETDSRKLDISNFPYDDYVFECVLESRLLANQSNRILVSEDTYLNNKLSGLSPTFSSEAIVQSIYPDIREELSIKLFDFNYVGITVYEETILKEFNSYLRQVDNKFDLCLLNLKQNPLNWQHFFKAAVRLSSGIYTRDKQRQTTSLLLCMFEALGTNNAMKILYLMDKNSPSTNFKACLTDAFRIYASSHVFI